MRKMLMQIRLPIRSFCNICLALRCAWCPTVSVSTSADIKTTRSNSRNRASVIQAAQHILNSNFWITLANVHQGVSGDDCRGGVLNLRSVKNALCFCYGKMVVTHDA